MKNWTNKSKIQPKVNFRLFNFTDILHKIKIVLKFGDCFAIMLYREVWRNFTK